MAEWHEKLDEFDNWKENMVLDEVLAFLKLTGKEDPLKAYAELLDSEGKDTPVAIELRGDEVSGNGLYIWDKKKAFINEHKHDIVFQEVSRVFEDPPPPGYVVFAGYPDPIPDPGGVNNRTFAIVPPDECLIIWVQQEGGYIRLISVMQTTKKVLWENMEEGKRVALGQGYIVSSSSFWEAYSSYFDSNGNICPESKNRHLVEAYLGLCKSFVEGEVSGEDAVLTLVYGLGMTVIQADALLKSWQHQKNVAYLAKQMGQA